MHALPPGQICWLGDGGSEALAGDFTVAHGVTEGHLPRGQTMVPPGAS